MASRSFKQDLTGRPLRYRTPSPPRDAFESISPTTDSRYDATSEHNGPQWLNNDARNNNRKRSYPQTVADNLDECQRSHTQGTMDAFASIALSTGSNASPLQPSRSNDANHRDDLTLNKINGSERPAKRARSEKLASPELRRSSMGHGVRPATSYGQSSDSMMLEAELLLNFAQEARFAVPRRTERQRSDKAISPRLTGSKIHSTISSTQDVGPEGHGASRRPLYAEAAPSYTVANGKSEITEGNHSNVVVVASEPPEHIDAAMQSPPVLAIPTDLTTLETGRMPNDAASCSRERNIEKQLKEQHHEPECQEAVIHTTADAKASPQSIFVEPPNTHNREKRPELNMNVHGITSSREDTTCDIHKLLVETSNVNGDDPNASDDYGFMNPMDVREGDPGFERLEQSIIPTATQPSSHHDSQLGTEEVATRVEESSSTHDAGKNLLQAVVPAVCAACSFSRSTVDGDTDNNSTSWISCDACKSWFHFACAGFKNEREVRGVDKFRCRKCRTVHGPTTFVRKSARAHSAIDYAGLHQGVIKTSDETPEHHYIKPIKEGTITFLPETFARIRPELVTAEYFEKGYGWKEPIVVPAAWNQRHRAGTNQSAPRPSISEHNLHCDAVATDAATEDWSLAETESEFVPDDGQDALDMVMPHDLTVRAVAELYGPEEKVEVIDVKSQNGEGKKWNMRRWADYYESKGNKIVRNVISLEVSQSKLGRLIRRPQIVRDLDLQDSVWPAELRAKGEIPRVQFYCLMSVADCFTDFHIDFGGSSVFYHILKGRKTFFFIPPKEKHLKKYEEWCLSPAQNWTFLGDQTKECYRVDLSEGDTMLIPAGWIHAVWTPEDSLVIGGNFLTRLNFGMQLRISQIEKATGVARKFRYPHFQKIHWYTAFRYMEEDPLPSIVQKLLQEGEIFYREQPAHHEFDDWGENSKSGLGNYHARYYSQAELEGLPDLTRYLLRTALIDLGSINDGITQETRNAVKRSIPRAHGEPLEVVKKFAAWCAWKRGNETIPSWAYPHVIPEPESAAKLSAAAQKKLDREAALHAPRRQSARMQSQQSQLNPQAAATQTSLLDSPSPRKRRMTSSTASNSHRKVACESCRKRRRACKHKDTKDILYPDVQTPTRVPDAAPPMSGSQVDALMDLANNASAESVDDHVPFETLHGEASAKPDGDTTDLQQDATSFDDTRTVESEDGNYLLKTPEEIASAPKMLTHLSGAGLLRLEHRIAGGPVNGLSVLSLNAPHSRGRTKACNDCRKSKRRCIHDEYGNEDPVKAREAAIPRPAAANKRRKTESDGVELPAAKRSRNSSNTLPTTATQNLFESPPNPAPTANMVAVPTTCVVECSLPAETQPPGQPRTIFSAFDQMQAAAESMPHLDMQNPKTQSDYVSANPPAPGARSCTTVPEISSLDIPERVFEDEPDEVQVTCSPTVTVKKDFPIDPALEHMSSSFSVPAASLVSPPASSHADASRTPPSPSASSSRHSSRHPKQIQRYTPESAPRRDSSSSVNDTLPTNDGGRAGSLVSEVIALGKETSPMTTNSTNGEDEGKAEVAPTMVGGHERKVEAAIGKSRGSMDGIADEESRRLIKELQAQDYGLRRRGKA